MSVQNTPKSVLITGTSTGFGNLATLSVARAGHTVYAGMRNVAGKNNEACDVLTDLARREGLDVRVIDLDVTSKQSVEMGLGACPS